MEKSQWGSKIGFILASAGSAIGLGAVWKFPYMTAANGGGSFLLVFLIATLLIGFPLLLAEFTLGRAAGVSAIKTFGKLGGRRLYDGIGWIGAFALFILLSFYSVIGGWILIYLGVALGELFQLLSVSDYTQLFGEIISNPWLALGAQAIFILLNVLIVSKGVEQGIEKASKFMMPLHYFLSHDWSFLDLTWRLGGSQLFPQARLLQDNQPRSALRFGPIIFRPLARGDSHVDLCFLFGQGH